MEHVSIASTQISVQNTNPKISRDVDRLIEKREIKWKYMLFPARYPIELCNFAIYRVMVFLCYMNKIREALKESRLSQTERSICWGKNFNVVNLYVVNKYQIALPTLYQIAEIFDMDVRYLLVSNKK